MYFKAMIHVYNKQVLPLKFFVFFTLNVELIAFVPEKQSEAI